MTRVHTCARHSRSLRPAYVRAQIWDVTTDPNPNLGGITAEFPVWTVADYAKQAAGLDLRGAVHVEAIVGQMAGEWSACV